MTTRRVAWRRSGEVASDELCTMTIRDGGLSLIGTILGAEGGLPTRIEYRVFANGSGLTTAVHVRDLRGSTNARSRSSGTPRAAGRWTAPRPGS